MKGIQKRTHPPRVRLPIIFKLWNTSWSFCCYINVTTWTACLTFLFSCISEFIVPSHDQFDQEFNLCLGNIAVDNWDNPQMLQIKIKLSKADPFRKRVNIYLSAISRDLCSIRGILTYLALRGNHSGPLLVYALRWQRPYSAT